jgi:hypothetical protein
MNRRIALTLGPAVSLVLSACSGDHTSAHPPQQSTQASSPRATDPTTTGAALGSDAPTSVSRLVGAPGEDVSQLLGTWDHRYNSADAQELIADFAGLVDENVDRVVARIGFVDEDQWWLGFLFDGELVLVDGVPEGDGGTYAVHGDQLTTTGAHDTVLLTHRWSLHGKHLKLVATEECTIDGSAKTDCKRDRSQMDPMMRMITENTFVRSGDDATY